MSDDVRIKVEILDQFTNELRNLASQYQALGRQQDQFHRKGQDGARKLSDEQRRLQQSVAQLETRFTSFGERTGRMLQGLIGTTTRWTLYVGGATVGAVTLLAREGIRLNTEFEKYRLTLETVQRSQAKANATMAWMLEFAKRTPFEIEGLAEATTQLEALGVSARKWLPLIGDMAAALGGGREEINQLVQAVGMLNAGNTGQAMRSFRRFGVTQQDFERQGIRFSKTGELTSSAQDAMTALEAIINSRFSGLMERLSGTFAGVMSNIKDTATQTLMGVLGPAFETAAKEAKGFLGVLEELGESGGMELLTNRLGKQLDDAFKSAIEFAKTNIFRPLESGAGFGDIAKNIFDQAKGPAAEFAVWFAGKLADGIIGAVTTLATSAEGRKALYVYAGFQALPLAMGAAGGMLGKGVGRLWYGSAAEAAGGAAAGSVGARVAGPLARGARGLLAGASKLAMSLLAIDSLIDAGRTLAGKQTKYTGAGEWLGEAYGTHVLGYDPQPTAIADGAPKLPMLNKHEETMFAGIEKFKSIAAGMKHEYAGLAETIDGFGKSASAAALEGMKPLRERADELIRPLLTLDQQIGRVDKRLAEFADKDLGLLSKFDAARRGGDHKTLMGLAPEFQRVRGDQALALMDRATLEYRKQQAVIQRNQSMLGQYASITGGGDDLDKYNFLKDVREAGDIRKRLASGDFGGLDFRRVLELQNATKMFDDRDIRRFAEREFNRDLVQQFGFEKGQSIFDQFKASGGFSEEDAAKKFERDMSRFLDAIENAKLLDVQMIEQALAPIREGIPNAFLEAGRSAVDEIVNRLKQQLPTVYSEAAHRIASEMLDSIYLDLRQKSSNGELLTPSLPPAGT